MRNRAKCKLCLSVIESKERHDKVSCSCGEISVDGGPDFFRCVAKDFANFLRVDDADQEIEVKVKEKDEEKQEEDFSHKVTREELLDTLDQLIKNVEALPPHAMLTPITHYDYCALLILLQSIFRMSP